MSDGNGKRIVSLEAARANRPLKDNDWCTVRQAREMAIQECAKVHEHYLTQIPQFTARMIQDALLSYGLIKPVEADIAPAPAPASPDIVAASDAGQADGAA